MPIGEMSEVATPGGLYRQYDIDRTYDAVDTYDDDASWFGSGKYPPDWDQRREAVKARDEYQCLRCGRYIGAVDTVQIHHLTPLEQGGSNELSNLATLCGKCHALIHPDVDDLDANWSHAPPFPTSDAPDSLSVVQTQVFPSKDTDPSGVTAVTELVETVTGRHRADLFRNVGAHADFAPETARRLPERLGGYLSGCNLELGTDEQGLVVTVEHGEERRPAELDTVVIDSDSDETASVSTPTTGVVTTTLPAGAEQATVQATTDDGFLEHTFELGNTPYTLVKLRTSGLYQDMAPPWREPTGGEQPYDPDTLSDDPAEVDEEELEPKDTAPPVWLAIGTLAALGLTRVGGGLTWLLFFVLGASTALSAAYAFGERLP
jgi:hypothetical protein